MSWLQEGVFSIEYAVHQTTRAWKNTYDSYIDLTNIAKQNIKLKKQISELNVTLIDYHNQKQEIKRLTKLLSFTDDFDKKEIYPAEVIAHHTKGPFQTIRIMGGSNHDLKIGMPVISSQGVVGQVLRVGLLYSDVQLITDGSFSLDVLIERPRIRGLLRGGFSHSCLLFLHHRANIKIGDTIITSGMLGFFPKGVPVGKVTKISYETDEIAQLITIEPWISLEAIEEVVVIKKKHNDVEKILDITKAISKSD
jgi:rod shape-determining protein MreC